MTSRIAIGDEVRVSYRLSGGERTGTVEYIDGAYIGVRMKRTGCIFEAYANELIRTRKSEQKGMHQ